MSSDVCLLDLELDAEAQQLVLGDPGELRASLIATWHGRMVNEWMSSFVFAELAERLDQIDERDAADECRAFAAEERRHGVLCGAVVKSAGGHARAEVAPRRSLPEHRDTTPLASVIRNVISISCMSETVAVALIGAERLEMPESPLRDLLTRIWSDEVGHARFGWMLVDRLERRLTEGERAAIEAYLPFAFRHLEAHELAHLPASSSPPIEGREYGLCSGKDARVLFYETVDEVIVPELERRNFAARRGWNASRANTRRVA